jgi:acyl carrier protein
LVDESLLACGRDPIEGELPPDAFLPEFLDSVVLSALIVNIEDEWSFEIADDEIEPELFESIDSLSDFVRSKVT